MFSDYCIHCSTRLDCAGGCSAHPRNWYCPNEDCVTNRKIPYPSKAEIAKRKILAILEEYNCEIQTDDYTSHWLVDKDTQETLGFKRR